MGMTIQIHINLIKFLLLKLLFCTLLRMLFRSGLVGLNGFQLSSVRPSHKDRQLGDRIRLLSQSAQPPKGDGEGVVIL